MTADLSEFQQFMPKRGCSVARALDDLTPKDATNLRAALDASLVDIPHSAISSWLAAHDIKLGPGPIARHRRDGCSCSA